MRFDIKLVHMTPIYVKGSPLLNLFFPYRLRRAVVFFFFFLAGGDGERSSELDEPTNLNHRDKSQINYYLSLQLLLANNYAEII